MPVLNFYNNAEKQFKHNYFDAMVDTMSGGICAFLCAGDMDTIGKLREMYPDVYAAATTRITNQDFMRFKTRYHKYKRLSNTLICIIVGLLILGAVL